MIPLVGAGGYFVRLGHIGGVLNSLNTFRGSTIPPKFLQILADFAPSSSQDADNLFSNLSSWQSSNSGLTFYLQSLATQFASDAAALDAPQPDPSLYTALAYLIAQMRTAAASVAANSIGWSVAPGGGNNGNPVWVVATKGPTGYVQENAFAESIAAACSQDAQGGGTAAGQESLTLKSPQAAGDPLSWLFPAGSGAYIGITAVDAGAQGIGGTQNWLKNSNFETWTVANIPDGWHITTGAAQVQQSTSVAYDGSSSLALIGDGITLASIYQQFGSDTGVVVPPLDQMAVNFWIKATGTPGGVLECALVDGTGAYINDNISVPNSFSVNLGTIGSTFQAINGIFRTPRVLPSIIRLRLKLTTAIPAGCTAYIDRLAMAEPQLIYQQSPGVCVFSGNAPMIAGDSWTLTVTNDRNGQFQTLLDRMFNMRGLGLLLPSSGSPTISNSLIA